MKNSAYWMIAVLFLVAFVTTFNYGGCIPVSGSDNSNNSGSSGAPPQVGLPNPTNGATNVPTNQQLSWGAVSGATYNVYFGMTSPVASIGNQSGTTYNPGTLTNGTTYYWRIDSTNAGGTTIGIVWSFTTGGSAPPSNELVYTGLKILSNEEYSGIPFISAPAMGIGQLPVACDISNTMPTPGNQGHQGSCVAWAVAYALKSQQEQKEKNWGLTTNNHLFSPAYIYNQINGGVDRGTWTYRALNILVSQGCATLATMPYDASDFLTQPSTQAINEAVPYKIESYRQINKMDPTEIKKFLASSNPLVSEIKLGTNFLTNNLINTNYVYKTLGDKLLQEDGTYDWGYHAITLVGYDDTKYAFKFINSWGTSYGQGGFAWIDYDFFPQICLIAYYAQDHIETLSPIVGSIYVTSNPTGASVSLDTVLKGTTPITIPDVPIGSHVIKVTKDGYQTKDTSVTVTENQITTITITLESEIVSTPNQPTGEASAITGTNYSYSTGGATSNAGDPIEYRFDWKGDGVTDLSPWGSATQSKTWIVEGTYSVKAQARCVTHTLISSTWSTGLSVSIGTPAPSETISTPNQFTAPTPVRTGISYNYAAGGATSNLGDIVEYQFDWKGDGTDLSSWFSSTQSKTWIVEGTFSVRARARCTIHTDKVSDWSSSLSVNVGSLPTLSYTGPANGATDVAASPTLTWSSNGTSFDIYLGEDENPPPLYRSNRTTKSYTVNVGDGYGNITFYWQIKATNIFGTTTGPIWSFTTEVVLPEVTTNAATNITTTSAQMNASLTATGGETCLLWIQYGSTTSLGSETTKVSKSNTGFAGWSWTGRTPNTTYYYRAAASNSKGTVYGSTVSFRTLQ